VRVVVNRLSVLGQKTGVGHYTAELLRGLAAQAGADQIACYPGGWLWHLLRCWWAVRPSVDTSTASATGPVIPDRPPSLLSRLKRAAAHGLVALKEKVTGRNFRAVFFGQPCDLYHEPNHIPLPCDLRTLATIHDLSALLHPEWHPPGRVAYYEKHFPRTLRQGCHFLTDCDSIRREVIQTLGLPPERVTRVYLGIRRGLAPLPAEAVGRSLRRLGLPPQYLLYVGTIEPRKNLLLLLRAYCALSDELRRRCPLLLVGRWGWNAGDVAEQLAAARHRGVIHLGYVPERHLAALYNGALALVYPSLYEGFGFPPLEMLACGGAVLASTAAALVEIVGGAAHLLDPHDLEGWRDAMARIVTDADWRQQLECGAEAVARPFTWERCAAETLQVYRTLCGGAPALRRLAG
jgi:alpha-1,3-rhamnosyl/mannosyltransferase